MDAFFAAIGLADASLFVRAVVAFLICLALLALLFVVLGALTGRSPLPQARSGGRQPRLGVIEETSVDAKRRLVLVRRDNAEHLILTGGPNDLLLEGPILRGAAKPRPEAQRRANARVAEQVGGGSGEAPGTQEPAKPLATAMPHPGDAGVPMPEPSPPSPTPAPATVASAGAGVAAIAPDVDAASTSRHDAATGEAPVPHSAPPSTPARAETTRSAPEMPTSLPVPSIAVEEPVVSTPAPQGQLRDDDALADAFARDFEADLGDVTDPDTVAERAEAHVASFDAADSDADADGHGASPPTSARGEPAPTDAVPGIEDLTISTTPPGAIPPRSLQEATPEDAVASDPVAPPRARGQVPLDDEPTPRLPRFLRAGNRDAPRMPEPPGSEVDADVVVTEGPRFGEPDVEPGPDMPAARPFEALYRARDGASRPSPILPSRTPEPAEEAPAPDQTEAAPAGTSEMQSLEAQMESLLRELTERGRTDGGSTNGEKG